MAASGPDVAEALWEWTLVEGSVLYPKRLHTSVLVCSRFHYKKYLQLLRKSTFSCRIWESSRRRKMAHPGAGELGRLQGSASGLEAGRRPSGRQGQAGALLSLSSVLLRALCEAVRAGRVPALHRCALRNSRP